MPRSPQSSKKEKRPAGKKLGDAGAAVGNAVVGTGVASSQGAGGLAVVAHEADAALKLFHPVTAKWFRAVFEGPTAPQIEGLAGDCARVSRR